MNNSPKVVKKSRLIGEFLFICIIQIMLLEVVVGKGKCTVTFTKHSKFPALVLVPGSEPATHKLKGPAAGSSWITGVLKTDYDSGSYHTFYEFNRACIATGQSCTDATVTYDLNPNDKSKLEAAYNGAIKFPPITGDDLTYGSDQKTSTNAVYIDDVDNLHLIYQSRIELVMTSHATCSGESCGVNNPPACGSSCPGDDQAACNAVCPGSCSNSGVCTINCLGKDACKDKVVTCPNNFPCKINCIGKSACGGNAKLYCPVTGQQCDIKCEDEDACKGNVKIYAGPVGKFKLKCRRKNDKSCEDAIVYCGQGKCVANCSKGTGGKDSFKFNSNNACSHKNNCD